MLYPQGRDNIINMGSPSYSSRDPSELSVKVPALISAQPNEDDQTDFSGKGSNQVASDIETDDETNNEHKNATFTDKWASATVVEEDNSKVYKSYSS